MNYTDYHNRTTVRGLKIEPSRGRIDTNPGHDYFIQFEVGPSTEYRVGVNAAELRRWSMILAEAALKFEPDRGKICPECLARVALHEGRVAPHEWDDAPCEGAGREPEAGRCPACRGEVHVDLSGELWPVTLPEIHRVRSLHRPVEYRPGDRYANYALRDPLWALRSAEKRPEVVMVCEECQARIDDADTSGGYGSWELAEYPCRTIRAARGEELHDE